MLAAGHPAARADRSRITFRVEATATAGYQRPAMYGLRIENATTLPGTMQHVLYHPADGTITNLTTCDAGVGMPGQFFGNIHTSKLAGFPTVKTLEAFDFGFAVGAPKALITELATLA